jgi:hypothetical protein
MAIFNFLARNETILANFPVAVTFFASFLCGRQKRRRQIKQEIAQIIKQESQIEEKKTIKAEKKENAA